MMPASFRRGHVTKGAYPGNPREAERGCQCVKLRRWRCDADGLKQLFIGDEPRHDIRKRIDRDDLYRPVEAAWTQIFHAIDKGNGPRAICIADQAAVFADKRLNLFSVAPRRDIARFADR